MNVVDMNGYEQQASFFRALSHPVRLRILDILAQQEACVCHLGAILGRPQPYISQQLATLREAGLVTGRREGTLIYYRLADPRLAELNAQGKAVAEAAAGERLDFPPVPHEALSNCPCPACQA